MGWHPDPALPISNNLKLNKPQNTEYKTLPLFVGRAPAAHRASSTIV